VRESPSGHGSGRNAAYDEEVGYYAHLRIDGIEVGDPA
jgi:hypothetical protein